MCKAKDGDLYKTVTLHGISFELRYGYYEDYERNTGKVIIETFGERKLNPVHVRADTHLSRLYSRPGVHSRRQTVRNTDAGAVQSR